MKKYFYQIGVLAFIFLYISFVRNVYSQNPATENADILNFPNVIINEVNFKDSEKDWIELFVVNDENEGNGNNIKGLKIQDDTIFFEISEDFQVKTNDYIMIYFKSDIEKVEINDIKKFFITKNGLTGTTEQVIIKNRNEEIIDAVCWTNDSPTSSEIEDFNEVYNSNQWAENDIQSCIKSINVKNGNSIARKISNDTNSINDWKIFIHPTPEKENIEMNEPPEAVITIQSGDTEGTNTLTINLDGSDSSDPENDELNFEWDYGDNTIFDTQNPPSHTFSIPGEYVIKLTVSDNFGDFDEEELTITVLEEAPSEENTEDSEDDLITIELDENCFSGIQINEIFPNPMGKDTGNEWIELINKGDKDCNLNGLYIDDKDGGSNPFYIEDKLLISNRFLLLPSWETKINLNNDEDEVRILTINDEIVDSIKYEKSIENKSFAKNEDNEFQWTKHLTPLTNNIFEEITHEESNETESTKKTSTKKKTDSKKNVQNGSLSNLLKINEIFPNPKGKDKGFEWIEIINDSEEDIFLGNWKITDNEGKKSYIFDNDLLEAHATKVFSDEDLGFSLKNTDGIYKLVDFENTLIDSINYEKSEENKSFARIIINDTGEETENWQWTEKITKDYSNPSFQKFLGLIINFDQLENKLELQVDPKKENVVISVIQSGDTLYETIFTEGTKIKITTSETETGERILEEYEIIEQAPPKEKNDDSNNFLYIILSALGPCSYFGYKAIRKFGLIKIM